MARFREYWNTISELQRTLATVQAWRLVQEDAERFRLWFSFVPVDRNDWAWVQTARGEVKLYKTAAAALKDIARVQRQAVIYTEFQDGIFS